MTGISRAAFPGLVVVAAISSAAYAWIFVTSAILPDLAATHFDVRGEPNAMSSREGYRGFMALLVIGMPLLIAVLPAFLARRWPRLLNIPNREHWLAPERIEATLSSIGARTAILAVAVIALQCFVHWLVLQANAASRPSLDQQSLLVALILFATFVIGWIVAVYRRFAST